MIENNDTFWLPLFPLNVVLYPNMLLPLHIFEPRYQAMIDHSLSDEHRAFGVILLTDELSNEDPDIPHSIGTIAQVLQVQNLEEGRMNILTLGISRFELLDYYTTDEGYLMGQVTLLEDESTSEEVSGYRPQIEHLARTFQDYINLVMEMSQHDQDEFDFELAEDPDVLSFQIGAVLDIDLTEKQALLEQNSLRQRLGREQDILEREITHLKTKQLMPEGPKTEQLPWGGKIYLN